MEGHEGHQDTGGRGGRSPHQGGRGGHHHRGGGGRNNHYGAPQRREVEPRQREIQESPNVVFVHTSDRVSIPALLKHIEDSVGAGCIVQHYFKERQPFGFVQFSSPEQVEKALSTISRTVFEGVKITIERSRVQPKKTQHAPVPAASSPSTPANGQPAAPAAATEPASAAPETSASSAAVAAPPAAAAAVAAPPEVERTNSIVVKNLPFQLKQEEFQEILNTFEPKSTHLKYHLDNGQFRGIAFIKYRNVEEATVIHDKFQSFEIGGRRIRCEFKRKQQAADLDLDDDDAKALWEQLNRFKESSQNEHPFPPTLTSLQRKQIHYFADRLGLVHFSQGEGEARFIVVTKRRERQPQGSNTVGLQPTDDKSWRARNQEEKKKAAQEPTLRIQPVRQPKGPDPGKGFSDEYRASRKLAPPPAPAPAPVPAPTPVSAPTAIPTAAAGSSSVLGTSPVTAKLSAAAPAFQPKLASPVVPHAAASPAVPAATVAAVAPSAGADAKK